MIVLNTRNKLSVRKGKDLGTNDSHRRKKVERECKQVITTWSESVLIWRIFHYFIRNQVDSKSLIEIFHHLFLQRTSFHEFSHSQQHRSISFFFSKILSCREIMIKQYRGGNAISLNCRSHSIRLFHSFQRNSHPFTYIEMKSTTGKTHFFLLWRWILPISSAHPTDSLTLSWKNIVACRTKHESVNWLNKSFLEWLIETCRVASFIHLYAKEWSNSNNWRPTDTLLLSLAIEFEKGLHCRWCLDSDNADFDWRSEIAFDVLNVRTGVCLCP